MQFAIDIALSLIYFALFLLVCAWVWRFWKMYINQKHLNNLKWVMLEIKLPREIFKSPLATETAISSLLQGGGVGTKYDRNYRGNLPIFSSLEIASIEGILHFYVRVQARFRPLVEANFYAQYPGIEIVEAEDYTSLIKYDHLAKDRAMWGITYGLGKKWSPINPETGEAYEDKKGKYEMPADFLPLKTYVDYALDKDPKEEVKVDPITPMLEFMGAIGKGEYLWFQILVQDEGAYNGKKKFPKFYVNEMTHEHVSLADMAKERKQQIRSGNFIKKGTKVVDQYGYVDKERTKEGEEAKDKTYQIDVTPPKKDIDLTMEEKTEIEAINKKLAKPLALSVVRAVYVVDTSIGKFNVGNVMNTLSLPKPFAGWNSLSPNTTDPYLYPWENYRNMHKPWREEEMFEAYVEREGFFPHITPRKWLDRWEDTAFWHSSMKSRKLFRMLYEGFLHPFSHPHASDAITLNLEEIATMWHLPGAVATTPTLPRIDSAKGVAPVNLPQ